MASNIVVLEDGTGQKGGRGHNTSIYRMYSILVDRTPKELATPKTRLQPFGLR